jgi:hypothetical protein
VPAGSPYNSGSEITVGPTADTVAPGGQLSSPEILEPIGGQLGCEDKPSKVCIDVGGLGVGVYDRLAEQGYSIVTAVNFGGKPIEPRSMKPAAPPVARPTVVQNCG